MNIDLSLAWAFIIAFSVFAYVVMDGFDLGIGILFPALDVGDERNRAINSVAPVWDGNETWLVLGGGGLFAAFPLAYAIVLPATYPLIIAMLLGLVFRGVAFEFRWRNPEHRKWWDAAFCTGSLTAALAQGMVLGALLQGIDVTGRAYSGSWFDWLTPYTLLTGIGTVAGYALLGATWLVWKTEDRLQDKSFRLARRALPSTLLLMGAVSLYTPFLEQQYFQRWFEMPNIIFASQVPLLVAIASYFIWVGLQRGWQAAPFLLSILLFLLGMVGLGVSMFPFIVPDQITIWDAATHPRSQLFMLVGTLIIMPIILAYTAWAYWIFRGKVSAEGYH